MDWQGVQPCSDGRKTGRWEDYKISQPYSPGRSMVHTQDLDRTLWEKFSPSTNEKMNQICHQMVNRQQTICEPRKENPQLTYNVTNILGPNTALNYKTYHMLNQAEKRTACISRAMIHNGFDTRLKMYFSWTPQRDRPLSFPCTMRNTTAIYYSITQIFFLILWETNTFNTINIVFYFVDTRSRENASSPFLLSTRNTVPVTQQAITKYLLNECMCAYYESGITLAANKILRNSIIFKILY